MKHKNTIFFTTVTLLSLLITFVLVISGCSGKKGDSPFVIAYSGNMIGGYAPCKCKGSQDGGLPRRSLALKQNKNDTLDCLKLDAGNFFASGRENVQERTELLIAGMQKYGIDAVNLAFRDIKNPIQTLRKFESEYQVPFISANVLDASTGKPAFPTHKIFTVGKTRMQVAVIGLANGGPNRTLEPEDGMEIEDPFTALRRELSQLPQSVGYVILLTEASKNNIEAWLQQIQEANEENRIDLVISSSNRENRRRGVMKIDKTSLVATGRQGKYFDMITISPAGEGQWTEKHNGRKLDRKHDQDDEMADFLINKGKILGIPAYKLDDLSRILEIPDNSIEAMIEENSSTHKP